MKRFSKIAALLITLSSAVNITLAQGWTQEANFTPGPRLGASYFSIGAKGYVCFGNDGDVNDLWAYDPASNTWVQMASLPATGGRNETVCFTIGNIGYIGLGYIGDATETNQVWGYDPVSNTWTQAAPYPGAWTRDAVAFAIDTCAYVVAGQASPVFYQYNQPSNTWVQKANIPTAMERGDAAAFSIGGKGYYGLGVLGATALDDIWEYDPATDNWTQKSNFAGGARAGVVAFATTTNGYIGTGSNNAGTYYNDFWEYDPTGDTWTQKPNVGGPARGNGVGFALGCSAYIGLGRDNADDIFQDFWGLSVCTTSPLTDSISATNDRCHGDSTGAASANPSGGTPPYTYLWAPAGQTTQTITGLTAGTYLVTVTDSLHATITDSVIITQPLQTLVLSVSTDTALCSGQMVTLTSSASGGVPGYTYQWSPVSGLSDSTGSTLTADPSHTTIYYVIATDSNACHSLPQSVTVTINSLPVPVITATDTIICSGDSTHLCTTRAYQFYRWNTTDTAACIYADQSGYYQVTVTDTNGCSAISQRLVISVYPVHSSMIIEQGDTITTFASVSYQWYCNGAPIPGDTTPVFVICSGCDSGTCTVRTVDSNGCATVSNPVSVICEGISQLSEDSWADVYPNPNPVGNWQLTVGNELIGANLDVFDEQGRLVFHSAISNQQSEIKFGAASGVYYLRISNEGISVVRKLVKM